MNPKTPHKSSIKVLLSYFICFCVIFYAGTVGANILHRTKSIAIKVLTHKYTTFTLSHVGFQMYGYYNAKADAWTWDTIYGDGVTHGKATKGRWHLNKNLANTGLLLIGYSYAVDYFMHGHSTRSIIGRFGTQSMGSWATWQRSYRRGRYNDPFPPEDWVYGHSILFPFPVFAGGDYVIQLNQNSARNIDTALWGVYGVGIVIDPAFSDIRRWFKYELLQ